MRRGADTPVDAPPEVRRGSGPAGPSLKARALRLLAQREHSRQELERKLRAHAADEDELVAALDALQARGFINEQRVADSVVHRRAPALGAARVRAELQAKGLAPALVTEAMAGLQQTEAARAEAVWRKKFGLAPTDAADRARQMRFLAARGFAPELVRRVVPRVATQAVDADEDGDTGLG